MEPLISLVIPVYNVEPYLQKCMETVLRQTYKNYEVILVDDGSTDNSGKMCDAYAAADARVRVFHKENGGLSDARNFGVQQARGDLVSFIDSDDYVTDDYLSYLYDLMVRYQADMSCCRGVPVSESFVPDGVSRRAGEEKCLSTGEAMKLICITASAWSKLYRKQDLLQFPYPFGKLYEDLYTTHKLASLCGRIAFGNRGVYYYVARTRGSINYCAVSERHMDYLTAVDEQLRFIKSHYPEAEEYAISRCCQSGVELLNTTTILKDPENGKKFFSRIRSHEKKYAGRFFRSPVPRIDQKVSVAVILMGYYPAKIFWPLRTKLRYLKMKVKNER